MKELFLDANAHIPLHPKALIAYNNFHQSFAGHGHPSSPSTPGRLAASALEIARSKIASLIGAQKPGQIVFTSSCTSACEWGIDILSQISDGTMHKFACSTVEHTAVRDAFEDIIVRKSGSDFSMLKVDKNGVVLPSTSASKVICIHMHNEIGVIQPIKDFTVKYLFSDMSQSLGKIPVNVTKLNVDIAVFGSHKFGGPGGIGFMYLKNPEHWKHCGTGSRYFLDRPGTPDIAGAVATSVALEEAISSLETRTTKMVEFQTTIEKKLQQLGFDIIGKNAPRSPNTTFVNIPEIAIETMLKLGAYGIHVGLGSACGSLHTGPSPLMKALGRAGGAHDFLRISQFGEYGEDDAKHFIKMLDKCL